MTRTTIRRAPVLVRTAAALALVPATGTCDRAPEDAVIGLAVGRASAEIDAEVARRVVAGWGQAGAGIRFVVDTAGADNESEVEAGRSANLLAVNGLVAVVGHRTSRGSLAAAPLYNEAGVVQLVPNGTSRRLRDAGPWTLSLAPNDSIEGEFVAAFAADRLGARSALVIYENTEFGTGVRDGVTAGLQTRGVEVLDRVPLRNGGDLEVLVDQALLRGVPDVVFLASGAEELERAGARLGAGGFRGAFILGDGVTFPAPPTGPVADSTYMVSFWHPDRPEPESRAFRDLFSEVAGRLPTGQEAMRHDALLVLAAAVRDVGADPGRIRTYLDELGGQRPPFGGATGAISFGPDRAHGMVMVRITDLTPVAFWEGDGG